VFFSDIRSRKGRELRSNPLASLAFYWQPQGRQVRVEGRVKEVTAAEADAYWPTRPRQSQLAASASHQSARHRSRRKEMVDWQPLLQVLANSNGLHSGAIFFALVVAILALLALAFVITPRGGDLALAAIAVVMGAAAFNVVRNMPLAVIASVAPLARHLHLLGNELRGAIADDSAATARDSAATASASTTIAPESATAPYRSTAAARDCAAAAPESESAAPAPDAIARDSAAVARESAADAPSNSNPAVIAASATDAPAPDAVACVSATNAPEATADAPSHFNRVGQAVIVAAALILTLGKGGLLSSRIPAAMDYPAGAIAFTSSGAVVADIC
jgi:Pyridoxamine 5'-phosphate oxidase